MCTTVSHDVTSLIIILSVAGTSEKLRMIFIKHQRLTIRTFVTRKKPQHIITDTVRNNVQALV